MRDLVIHGPSGVQLDFALDDFGGADQAEIIRDWKRRPPSHGRRTAPGEFICHQHQDHEHPWLYLQERGPVLVAAHWPGTGLSGSHEISHHAGLSDEHKRQTDYVIRAGQAAGFQARAEVTLPTGTRPDAVLYGSALDIGVEVQRSKLSAPAAKGRTTRARNAGVHSVWLSDWERNPEWFARVPGVRLSKTSWEALPPPGSVKVASGLRSITAKRCRSIVGNTCPRRHRGCNDWHAVHEPRDMPLDALAEQMPAGQIVPMLYRTLSGARAHVYLVHRNDKLRYEAITKLDATYPEPDAPAHHRPQRAACVADAGPQVVHPATPAPAAPAAPVVACSAHTYWPSSTWRCRVPGCPGSVQ